MQSIRFSRTRLAALLGAVVLCAASPLTAQTGGVAGKVTDRTTGLPLGSARVQVVGILNAAANTDDAGTFLIRNVPAGPVSLRVTRLGYRPEVSPATIPAGDTVSVTITMSQSAVELQQVVVTGTGGATEKRQIGASLGTVNVAQMQEVIPTVNFSQVLAAKVTGVRSVGVGGGVGGGNDLRIRGMSSFSLNQRPVIYIDGVRVDSRGTEWAFGSIACCSFTGGNSTDRLSDLNPNDIENIEVLKGAAAATLYGSEATNGVIQIFTKKGRGEGRTQWALGLQTGFNRLRGNLPTKEFPRFTGPDGTQARDANELIKSGAFNGIDLSGQGGTERSTYFVSGLMSYEEGSIQPNDQTKGNLRLNTTFVPSAKTTVQVQSSYTRNFVNELQAGNNWTALLGNAMNGNPRNASAARPFGEAWVSVADIEQMETTSDTDRWNGGVTLNYQMTPSFAHRFTAGTDAVNDQKGRFFPFAGGYGSAGVNNGQRNLGVRNFRSTTLDYLSTLKFGLPFGIESNFSAGAQGFFEKERLNIAIGNNFPGPGVSTVSAAALLGAGEQFRETINFGVYFQNRFAWKDRLFTTVGLRMDGNSAFGADYGLQKYPKVDVSYDLARHEGLLPSMFSALRLRGALGRAGKFPGAFDSFQSYTSAPVYEGETGVVPANPGNANLKPEVSTELEGGFEVGLWNDRVGIEASLYHQRTTDAIVPLPNAPSAGFNQNRSVNIGAIDNHGWEASVNYIVFSQARSEWSTQLRFDGNKNKVTDLGGVVLAGNAVRLGYPIQGIWDRVPTGFSVVTGGTCPSYGCPTTTRSSAVEFLGPPLPTFNASLGNTFRYGPLQFYGLVTMEKGAILGNGDRAYRIRQGGADEYLSALGPNGERTFKADSIAQFASILNYNDKRDNIRLRELSVTYQIPVGFSNLFKVGRSNIQLSGQNVMWWDDCHCVDPNMNWAGASSFGVGSGFLAQPSPRQFRLSIRSRF